VLHSFTGTGGDGNGPSGLIQGSDGNLYGLTGGGGSAASADCPGSAGCGTVFKITPAGVATVLYFFTGTGGDGRNPYAGLVQGSDGNFYGTTYLGGTGGGAGTVFELSN
jgi:uncharacterized repeat protein (TIGR03803 family)